MNLLELLPGISGIIERVIPDPNKKAELELELSKVQADEVNARMGVLQGMLSNKSLFVAGAIPALLWLAVLGLLNNYVLGPWFGLEPINFPDQYWTLLSTVVIGLFGKKVVDGNEFRWPNGNVLSPKKEAEIPPHREDKPPDHVPPAKKPRSPEDIDARLAQLDKEYRKNG
nr:3TM-type holin [uncultured Dethiosulfovibrio sp.]